MYYAHTTAYKSRYLLKIEMHHKVHNKNLFTFPITTIKLLISTIIIIIM